MIQTYSNKLDQCAADVVSGEEIPEDLSKNITGFISPASQVISRHQIPILFSVISVKNVKIKYNVTL